MNYVEMITFYTAVILLDGTRNSHVVGILK